MSLTAHRHVLPLTIQGVFRDCLVGMAQRCPITYRALADKT